MKVYIRKVQELDIERLSMKKKVSKRQLTYGLYITISFMILGVFLTKGNSIRNNAAGGQKEVSSIELTAKPVVKSEKKVTNIKESIGDLYIKINKNEKTLHEIQLKDNYMEKELEVSISNCEKSDFNLETIEKVSGKKTTSITTGGEDQVVRAYSVKKRKQNSGIILKFTFDRIYSQSVYEDEEAIYIDLRDPKEVYPHVIVVDAGHGGQDCGSYTEAHYVEEKDLNLAMVLSLKEKFDKDNIKVYYTRLEDQRVTLTQRVNLANELNADLFLSIHCNFCQESASPWGIEVLYNETQEGGALTSKEFSQICLDNMVEATGRQDRGLIEGNSIHIIRNSLVPVALIEAGFISNWEDLQYLRNEETQAVMVDGIYNGIKEALQKLARREANSNTYELGK